MSICALKACSIMHKTATAESCQSSQKQHTSLQEVIDNPATAEEMNMIKTTCTTFGICVEDSYQTNCLYIRYQDFETLDFVIQTTGIHMVSIRFGFL